jgi:hypothetical protein
MRPADHRGRTAEPTYTCRLPATVERGAGRDGGNVELRSNECGAVVGFVHSDVLGG